MTYSDKSSEEIFHNQKRKIGSTDVCVTRLGYGGTAVGGPSVLEDDFAAHAVIDAAYEEGIRYFDTSPFYGSGLSEHRMGGALRSRQREEFMLSTKVGRLLVPNFNLREETSEISAKKGFLEFTPEFNYSAKGAHRSFEDSLQRLGMDRIDMLFLHDISHKWHGNNFDRVYQEAVNHALPALVKLRDEGKIGAIGLGTNDLEAAIPMVRDGRIDCVMIAGQYNLITHSQLLGELSALCRTSNVSLISAAPFASGILATGAVEGAHYMYEPAQKHVVEKVEAIERICKKYSISLAAAALQFADMNPLFSSVVAGMRTIDELAQAIEAFNTKIPNEFWQQLKGEGLIDLVAPTNR